MAIVFLVKDGPRGDRTSEGKEKSIVEVTQKLIKYQCRFLGIDPPQFNTATSGDYYRHVVIQVTKVDATNDKFDRVGFYVVADLDASQSTFLVT
ncbi:MAG: hypothetical protein ACREBC_07365 [Pyrinomonadaceae bacterium]